MKEQSPLARYVAGGDPFALHVVSLPALADYVDRLMIQAEELRDSRALRDLLIYRDAVHELFTVAYEEGFEDAAFVFEQSYQRACQALLSARPGW